MPPLLTPEQMAALHPELFRVSAVSPSTDSQWAAISSLITAQVAALRAAISAGKDS